MLQVEEGLRKQFPSCEIKIHEPEHAVVNGATIYADMPQINILKDIASFSYGTESNTNYGFPDNKKIVSDIIIKNNLLPVTEHKIYTPISDSQREIAFSIYESEYEEQQYDFSRPNKRFIGTVTLKLPPNSPKELKVRCQLSLNTEGMLEVTASEPSGNKIMSTFKLQEL